MFGLILIGSIILSGAVSAAGLATSPQPKYQHDNQNTGQSQYKGPTTNTTKWVSNLSGETGSPVIGGDGTIYIGSAAARKLYAFYPNGKQKWCLNNSFYGNTPTIGSDGTIYVDYNVYGTNSYSVLNAINPNGTKKSWNFNTTKLNFKTGTSDIQTDLCIGSDGTIYCAGYYRYSVWDPYWEEYNYVTNGILYAINPDSTLKWNYTIPTEGTIISSQVAIGHDGTIYLGSSDYLYALNPSGTLKWKYLTNADVSDPVIGKDGTVYLAISHNLLAINPNGSLKWNKIFNPSSEPAVGSDGTIFIGSFDNKLYAINPNGTIKWSYSTASNLMNSDPAIDSQGTVYFASGIDWDSNLSWGKLYAINSNGTLKWKFNCTGYLQSSIAIGSDGTLYFGCTKDYNPYSFSLYALQDPDKTSPTAYATPTGGLYNTSKTVILKMSELGTIYYTLNGTTPTTSSKKYTTPLVITASTILKFFAKDLAGNLSPIYTQKYTIDKIAPKVSSTTPTNLKTGVSRTATITIKFNENIKASTYFSAIKIKNLSTGKYETITKTVSGNILYIKTSKRTANTWYQVTIPAKAIKDYASNNLQAAYTFKFKTGT